MEQSEPQIIKNLNQNQSIEFAQVYDLYIGQIYGYLFNRVQNRQIAEDLTSEVFLKALKAFDRFDPNRASVKTWLYQIARNHLIDYYRTRKVTEDIEQVELISENLEMDSELENTLNLEKLRKLLSELPEESRELITLRIWDELSYKEIAEVTGKNEGALKVAFSRVLKQLQLINH